MPARDFLPGEKGKDYSFVRAPNGKIYVVYKVSLPGGRTLRMSWTVPKDRYDHFGVNPSKVNRIGRDQFRNLHHFGEASDITSTGSQDHPFQTWMKELARDHRGASWLNNAEVVGIFLEGMAEGRDAQSILDRVKTTKWYKKRTDRRREWELEINPAQRQAEMKALSSRLANELQDNLLGAGFDFRDVGLSGPDFNKAVERIASGRLGDVDDGIAIWLENMRSRAERVEGTVAWIEREQAAATQNEFMNRPEDMREQLRQEAFAWLGPKGVPDNKTLMDWAQRRVSEQSSDADWQKFLRQQAKALYPWLGPEERWQDRAASYKGIAESLMGQEIAWNHRLLSQIEAADDTGTPQGRAMDFGEWERKVRSTNEFWTGPVAREETFDALARMNSMFKGVTP